MGALVSWLCPLIGPIVNLMSSVFCVCNNLLFPVIFFYLARKLMPAPEVVGMGRKLVHVVVFGVGLFVFRYGVEGGIASFREAIGDAPEEEAWLIDDAFD